MTISRRLFLGTLTSAAAGVGTDPEAFDLEVPKWHELEVGDCLVVRLPEGAHLAAEDLVAMGAELRRIWPDVLLLEHGAELEVLRRGRTWSTGAELEELRRTLDP